MQAWNWDAQAQATQAAAAASYAAANTQGYAMPTMNQTQMGYQQFYGNSLAPATTAELTQQQLEAQQQHWQQWQQWQTQYQQWHQEYGDKYQASLSTLAASQGGMKGAPHPPAAHDGAQPPPMPPPEKPPPPPEPEHSAQGHGGQKRMPEEAAFSAGDGSKKPRNDGARGGKGRWGAAEPPETPVKEPPPSGELSEAEKVFDSQFQLWEKQFTEWKAQNINHPDKSQYLQYEDMWRDWREKLLQRRVQMRKKREMSTPAKTTTEPPPPPSHESQPRVVGPGGGDHKASGAPATQETKYGSGPLDDKSRATKPAIQSLMDIPLQFMGPQGNAMMRPGKDSGPPHAGGTMQADQKSGPQLAGSNSFGQQGPPHPKIKFNMSQNQPGGGGFNRGPNAKQPPPTAQRQDTNNVLNFPKTFQISQDTCKAIVGPDKAPEKQESFIGPTLPGPEVVLLEEKKPANYDFLKKTSGGIPGLDFDDKGSDTPNSNSQGSSMKLGQDSSSSQDAAQHQIQTSQGQGFQFPKTAAKPEAELNFSEDVDIMQKGFDMNQGQIAQLKMPETAFGLQGEDYQSPFDADSEERFAEAGFHGQGFKGPPPGPDKLGQNIAPNFGQGSQGSNLSAGNLDSKFGTGNKGPHFGPNNQVANINPGNQGQSFGPGNKGFNFGQANQGPNLGPGNQGPNFGPGNQGSNFGPGNQGSNFGPGNQGSNFGPGNQGSNFGPGTQGPNFGPGNQGPNFVPGNQGPNFGPGNQGSNFGPGNQGPNFGPGNQGPNFGPGNQRPNFGPGNQGSNFGPGNQASNFGPGNQGSNFGPGNQGPNFGPGNQGPNFSPGNQGSNFGLGNQGPKYGQGNQGPNFGPGIQGLNSGPGQKGPNFGTGNQGSNFVPGNKGPNFGPGNKGPNFGASNQGPNFGQDMKDPSFEISSKGPNYTAGGRDSTFGPASLDQNMPPGNHGPSVGPGSHHPKFVPGSKGPNFGPENKVSTFGPEMRDPSFGPGYLDPGNRGSNFGPGIKEPNFGPGNKGPHPGQGRPDNRSGIGFGNLGSSSTGEDQRWNHGQQVALNQTPASDNSPNKLLKGNNLVGASGPAQSNFFPQGPRDNFPQGPRDLPQGPRDNFPQGPRDFPQGPRDNFPQGPRDNFPQRPRDFPPGSKDNFPRGPRDNFPPGPRDSFPLTSTKGFPYDPRDDDFPEEPIDDEFQDDHGEDFPPDLRDNFPPGPQGIPPRPSVPLDSYPRVPRVDPAARDLFPPRDGRDFPAGPQDSSRSISDRYPPPADVFRGDDREREWERYDRERQRGGYPHEQAGERWGHEQDRARHFEQQGERGRPQPWENTFELEPATIVEYGHKPPAAIPPALGHGHKAPLTAPTFLAPVQTFDYGHGSGARHSRSISPPVADAWQRSGGEDPYYSHRGERDYGRDRQGYHPASRWERDKPGKREDNDQDDRYRREARGPRGDRDAERERDRGSRYRDTRREDGRNGTKSVGPPPVAPPPPTFGEAPAGKGDVGAKSAPAQRPMLIEDLLQPPGRSTRPAKIVVILRGPPGSGKSFVAKLLKDKEVEQGGSAPRILCLDDYFMVETEKEEKDKETGRKRKIKVMEYEYEAEMEKHYRSSLIKAFRKTVADNYFPFIIVDCVNQDVKHFEEMWSHAKQKGFQVYVCEMDMDLSACVKRNTHDRTEKDIASIIKSWQPTPAHYLRLDVRSLLQSAAIADVEMEDSTPDDVTPEEEEKEEKKEEGEGEVEDTVCVSKWEQMDPSGDTRDRLDGLMRRKADNPTRHATLEDWLTAAEDYDDRQSLPGKKRVRWADLEEKRSQEKMRAIGFVVGQTDWSRMTDPTCGESALTQTKYI